MTRADQARIGKEVLRAIASAQGFRFYSYKSSGRWTRRKRARVGDVQLRWSTYSVSVSRFKAGRLMESGMGYERNYWQYQRRIVYSELYRNVLAPLLPGNDEE